jgi:hypothetical protein
MSYKPRSLFQIVEQIGQHRLLLPHIQRPFVWDDEQMVRLFDSLMRNYPIQTLLFWRTTEEIKARQFMEIIDRDADLSSRYDQAKSAAGVEKTFVLDGQQRLQTLYALFCGGVTAPDGQVREAYFDATAGAQEINDGDLKYQLVFSPSLEIPHYRIRNLMERDAIKDAAMIGDDLNDALAAALPMALDDQRARERRVRSNIARLRSLLKEEQDFWVEELDGVANQYAYRTVLDIFVRVNSGGTKLTASDLMFAALKEGWGDIEENTEQTVDLLNSRRLGFETSFPLKCLLVAHGDGAEVNEVAKFTGARGEALLRRLRADWDRAAEAFQQLRDFIEQDLRLFADKLVRSYNAFVPLFDYLFHNPRPDPVSRTRMRAYYSKAQIFNWFGASGDTRINALHHIVGKPLGGFPLLEIKEYFQRLGLGVELTENQLHDNRLRAILLSLVYVERWGASPFDVAYKGNEPHVDHIYPQSMLRTRLGQHSTEINDIGNLRYVGAGDNLRKRAELPDAYFARLKRAGVDIHKHLLVTAFADAPDLMAFEAGAFNRFREERRAAIWATLRRVVDPEVDGA